MQRGALEHPKGFLQRGQLLRRGVFGKQLASQALEFFAHLVDAFGLFGKQPVGDGPAVRNDPDQSLRFELSQRFAHQRAADAGHFAQLALGQPLAGL